MGSLYACGYSPEEIEIFILSEDFLIMSKGNLRSENRLLIREPSPNSGTIGFSLAKDSIVRKSIPLNVVTPTLLDFEMLKILLERYGFYDIKQQKMSESELLDYEEPLHVEGMESKWQDLNKKFFDNRGYFQEIVLSRNFNFPIVFTAKAFSRKNVIRGLHIQTKDSQGKFVTVIKGRIFDVAVDLRKNSKTFGKFFSCILSEKKSQSIYIPPGFAHGFCGLDKENYIIYSCTQYRNAKSEKAIKYNDKKLNIKKFLLAIQVMPLI